jgi:glycosyltransferase involved in cell wall biosynthesis
MRVLLHALAMRKRGGSSRHLQGLVQSLGQIDREHEYLLCLNSQLEFTSPYPNICVYSVETTSTWQRLWWDQVSLPRLARERRMDVVVSLLNLGMFWSSVPQIVLERNSQFYCSAYLGQLRGRAAFDMSLRRWMAYLTMRASRFIVPPSAAMREMIRRYHPDLALERFRILPHGFERAQLAGQALPEPAAQQLARVHGRPMILYISHLEPHKGVEVAIWAMRELAQQGQTASLVLTMERRDWPEGYDRLMALVNEWKLENDVINLGRVSESALDELYRRADVFLFPSLCESFGFPMVEAMGYGLPVVAADTPINREVCGEAALYYASPDGAAAAQQLAVLLGSFEQRQWAREISQRQFPRSHLTWPEYARRFIELVRETTENGSR